MLTVRRVNGSLGLRALYLLAVAQSAVLGTVRLYRLIDDDSRVLVSLGSRCTALNRILRGFQRLGR